MMGYMPRGVRLSFVSGTRRLVRTALLPVQTRQGCFASSQAHAHTHARSAITSEPGRNSLGPWSTPPGARSQHRIALKPVARVGGAERKRVGGYVKTNTQARVVAFTYELFWWPARLALGVHAEHVMKDKWFYLDVVVDSFYIIDIFVQVVEGAVKAAEAKKAAAAAYAGNSVLRAADRCSGHRGQRGLTAPPAAIIVLAKDGTI